MIKIQVGASSANLGPGFDTCGLALGLYNTYTFSKSDQLAISGCPIAYQNEDNLVYKSYCAVFEYLKKDVIPVALDIDAKIPLARGLGSSSACIVGGVLGANALLDNPLSDEEIFTLCSRLEGHPDNVAPALFGGLSASLSKDGSFYHGVYDLNKKYKFVVCIPNFELSTVKARSVLPKEISREKAVSNIASCALTLKALENGDSELLKVALHDELHEPYRKSLINEYDELTSIDGHLVHFISGAGPTVMFIYEDDKFIEQLQKHVETLKVKWEVLPLEVDYVGALGRR